MSFGTDALTDSLEQIEICQACTRPRCNNCISVAVYNRNREKMMEKYDKEKVIEAYSTSSSLSEISEKLGVAPYATKLYIRKALGGRAVGALESKKTEET